MPRSIWAWEITRTRECVTCLFALTWSLPWEFSPLHRLSVWGKKNVICSKWWLRARVCRVTGYRSLTHISVSGNDTDWRGREGAQYIGKQVARDDRYTQETRVACLAPDNGKLQSRLNLQHRVPKVSWTRYWLNLYLRNQVWTDKHCERTKSTYTSHHKKLLHIHQHSIHLKQLKYFTKEVMYINI